MLKQVDTKALKIKDKVVIEHYNSFIGQVKRLVGTVAFVDDKWVVVIEIKPANTECCCQHTDILSCCLVIDVDYDLGI